MNLPGFFFSCDWGTSSFRLRLVETEGERIRDEWHEAEGAKVILNRLAEQGRAEDASARAAAFEEFLKGKLALLSGRSGISSAGIPVLISGMASSTVGWKEVPYAAAPFPLDASRIGFETIEITDAAGARVPVTLLSGVTTGRDMMRGEETEILGLLTFPEWRAFAEDCVLVLPGTHSKHVRARGGAVVDFQTHMTGELLELLATQSLLKVSLRWPLPEAPGGGMPEEARAEFQRGVGLARGAGLGRGLFQTRVRSVLDRVPPGGNGWFLHGLLLGSEMFDLIGWAVESPILLAATPRFAPACRLALEILGAGARLHLAAADQMRHATVRAHALILRRMAGASTGGAAKEILK